MIKSSRSVNDWDPKQPDQDVRIKANPGRRGKTTGKVRQAGTRTLVEIRFGPAERIFKPKNLLELCSEDESVEELLKQGRFGGPADLRRILTFEKIKGELTNVFYSMESSQTDFYAHQFKPVLKLLDSPVGRLLIADEVGLGKTIEAMYIWKELQTRADARRILIVCPAMLRQKWKDDLAQRFNIFAEIVDAKDLLGRTKLCLESQQNQSFACIASLEGLRPSGNWEDINTKNTRAELARLLDANPANDEFGLFDLAVIDEAHYLRNAATASNLVGRLIRDASRYLLLLTATPVQIDNSNLFQLLRLISPDDFFSEDIFSTMLGANQPVMRALRYLWASPPEPKKARDAVNKALESHYFKDSYLLNQVKEKLEQSLTDTVKLEESDRVELGYKLEKSSLLGQYITRSRKRDVLPNRVKRDPQTLTVEFSPLERKFYDEVTEAIRSQTKGKKGVSLLSLIARQRQMASCMVAALETWRADHSLKGLVEESLWEDMGIASRLHKAAEIQNSSTVSLCFNRVSILDLEAQDSKYNKLKDFLDSELAKDSAQKFVIFAYFRGTLKYLARRLNAAGISTGLIMGDMGDRKWEVVQQFRQPEGPSVLLSSEVGSEGIDLQHCRFLVNYDLPWNPMRVEQRIGRLDRLNQKAERISIVNFSLKDTVEAEILERLYKRIRIFEESVGDIESILGEMTENLMLELFEETLTPEEERLRIEQTATALENKRLLQDNLEKEAVNMLAFSDHILEAIEESKAKGRWLQPDEVYAFVQDCFSRYYPGTVITLQQDSSLFDITLSEKAKVDLQFFISQNRCATPTQLHKSSGPVSCFFDPKIKGSMGKRNELLDSTHPLILWIRDRYATAAQTLHPVSAIHTTPEQSNLEAGLYAYAVYLWTFTGLRTESQIAYKLINVGNNQLLDAQVSESVLSTLVRVGQIKPNASSFIQDINSVIEAQARCREDLEDSFGKALEDFYEENDSRCDIQEKSARAFAERKQHELAARIERFKQSGKTRIIPATQGQLNKVNRELEVKLISIQQKRDDVVSDQRELAAGVILVETT
ncbi:Helicase conserved C-terminal domain protein [Synechococcus sp. PCC 7335]|uniref:SNF2-related protein n=1 Tax=Synechococcus sp. (strain ATCC 29403 / PCC 7335) TaxID=91464 RepID=UPI00017ECAFC|nr:SNF2-related protein [Synechococcus sp. PCC 7335]EDX85219.1 Helicase conserved C-terminal domain protein [Synechococcus sp. PCC 7335]